jgi:hypothetical protein
MLKPFAIFSSLLNALWRSVCNSLKISWSSASKIVLKSVLPVSHSLVKASYHCPMTSSVNTSNNVGVGRHCFTPWLIRISLLVTDVRLSVFIFVCICRLWTVFSLWSENQSLVFTVFHGLPRGTASDVFPLSVNSMCVGKWNSLLSWMECSSINTTVRAWALLFF